MISRESCMRSVDGAWRVAPPPLTTPFGLVVFHKLRVPLSSLRDGLTKQGWWGLTAYPSTMAMVPDYFLLLLPSRAVGNLRTRSFHPLHIHIVNQFCYYLLFRGEEFLIV